MRAWLVGGMVLVACAEAPQDDVVDGFDAELTVFHGELATARWSRSTVQVIGVDGTCTGVLLDRTHVLTAAHCVDEIVPELVWVGGANPGVSAGNVYVVADAEVHPAYDPVQLTRDVAVLTLTSRVTESLVIFPVLPPSLGLGSADEGNDAVVAGFGLDENGGMDVRRSAFVPITDVFPEVVIHDGVDANTCFGDSGGPFYVQRSGKIFLGGISSFGDGSCNSFGGVARLDIESAFLSLF